MTIEEDAAGSQCRMSGEQMHQGGNRRVPLRIFICPDVQVDAINREISNSGPIIEFYASVTLIIFACRQLMCYCRWVRRQRQ